MNIQRFPTKFHRINVHLCNLGPFYGKEREEREKNKAETPA